MATLFSLHVAEWKDCTACPLHQNRTKIVLSRGKVPCDVMFLGEAPGPSENVLGMPFVGPAGKLLDLMIGRAMPTGEDGKPRYRTLFTNLVACMPVDEDGNKVAEPEDDEVLKCSVRLKQLVNIAKPKMIVCVGSLARDWTDPRAKRKIEFDREIPHVDIVHPAYILRQNVANQGLMVKRCVITIQDAIDEYLVKKEGPDDE